MNSISVQLNKFRTHLYQEELSLLFCILANIPKKDRLWRKILVNIMKFKAYKVIL